MNAPRRASAAQASGGWPAAAASSANGSDAKTGRTVAASGGRRGTTSRPLRIAPTLPATDRAPIARPTPAIGSPKRSAKNRLANGRKLPAPNPKAISIAMNRSRRLRRGGAPGPPVPTAAGRRKKERAGGAGGGKGADGEADTGVGQCEATRKEKIGEGEKAARADPEGHPVPHEPQEEAAGVRRGEPADRDGRRADEEDRDGRRDREHAADPDDRADGERVGLAKTERGADRGGERAGDRDRGEARQRAEGDLVAEHPWPVEAGGRVG